MCAHLCLTAQMYSTNVLATRPQGRLHGVGAMARRNRSKPAFEKFEKVAEQTSAQKGKPELPEDVRVFEWRAVANAQKPQEPKPLSHTAALIEAASHYRVTCCLAEAALQARDEAERKLL